MAGPWYPERPIWERLPRELGVRAREWFEERAAVVEFDAGDGRQRAELYAYAILFVALDRAGVLRHDDPDAARQLDRARRFANHLAVLDRLTEEKRASEGLRDTGGN